MSEISVVWEKLKFDSFTGGCYTPHTHAAIDRTITTILVSFPNETSSVLRWSYWKKLPALGGRLVSCHISIQGFKFELHAGALPFCYQWSHKYVLFYRNSKNIAFRTVIFLAFHKTLRLKDSCSNSDCFSGWARYGSPCHERFGEIDHGVISTGILSLLPNYVGKLSYTDETMFTRWEGLNMSRNSVDRLTDLTVVWLDRKFSVKQ